MNHLLDNMIWNALSTGNRDLAHIDNDLGCFREDIAPFAGMESPGPDSMDRLHAFLPKGRAVALTYPPGYKPDPLQWKVIREMDCCQMVYEFPVKNFETAGSELIVPLTEEHIPQMLELTALTKPGPFHQRTILFGNYFGVFRDGRLAAMTGQRMYPDPYLEVSAVCTHPDFRGRGYARALMLHLMKMILDRELIPFLHVLTNNTGAIQLYESIGYRTRRRIDINLVSKT